MGEVLQDKGKRAGGRQRTWRWSLAAVSATLIGAGSLMLAGGTAGADSALTQGSSSAQSMWVGPHEGSLAIGAIFGVALAGNTGNSAKAQSEGADLGALGAAIKGYNCNMPPSALAQFVPDPLIVETGEPGASQGITQGPTPQDWGANEYGLAQGTPYAESDTTYAGPLADPSNAFVISGMHSKAWSGVLNGVDEAGSSSDIGSISLGGGAVVLNGLHWESVSPTNGGGHQTGGFTIGQVKIAGTAIPSADLSAVSTAVNQALGNLGILVNFPTSTTAQGIQFVSPLQIEVVPNTNRDAIVDPVVVGTQPPYYQIANGLENGFSSDSQPYSNLGQAEPAQIAAALCESDTPITVADITIASMDGGGFFSTELGGVNSSDGPLQLGNFSLGTFGIGGLNPGSLGTVGSLGTPATPGLGTNGANPSSTIPSKKLPAQAERAGLRGTSAGGPLLGAGLGALALLLALVEGDRRLMRRAQKSALAAGVVGEGGVSGAGPGE